MASKRDDVEKPKDVLVIEEESLEPKKSLVSSSRFHLGLKLSSASIEAIRQELNLYNPPNNKMAFSPPCDSSNEATRKKSRVFTCKYCKKEFSTHEALGGHQNAHKLERTMAKGRHGKYVLPFGHPKPSTTLNMSALGVRADSMIHKLSTYNPWSMSGLTYLLGQHNMWSNNSSALDKLKTETLQTNNNNNMNKKGIEYSPVATSISKYEENGCVIHDFLGVLSNISNLQKVNEEHTTGGLAKSNQLDESWSGILDLNLKL